MTRWGSIVGMCAALAACNQPAAETTAEPPAATPANEPAPSAVNPAPAPAAPAAHDHAAADPALAAPMPAVPEGAKVGFLAPKDGEKLVGPLENGKVTIDVKMDAQGIALKPAGAVEAGSGHHHITIDAAPIAAGTVVPKDDTHLHYGQGQNEAKVALTPGEHTLTMQFADGVHRSYGPQLASTIKVTVAAAGSVDAPVAEKTDKAAAEKPALDKGAEKPATEKAHAH